MADILRQPEGLVKNRIRSALGKLRATVNADGTLSEPDLTSR